MTNVLIVAGVILALVFALNLLRVRNMQPRASTIRLVPAALLYTEAFALRVLSILLFVVGIPLMIIGFIGAMARPR